MRRLCWSGPGCARAAAGLLAVCAVLVTWCAWAAGASGELAGVGWAVDAHTDPTYVPPGARAMIRLEILEVGAGRPEGTITVSDTLPHGLVALAAGELEATPAGGSGAGGYNVAHRYAHCAVGQVVTCALNPSVGLPYNGRMVDLGVLVEAEAGASGTVVNRATVAGGGAVTPAAVSDPITISASQAPFGLSEFDVVSGNADGSIDTQAGSHPYELTFNVQFTDRANQNRNGDGGGSGPDGEVKDVVVNLPRGLVGDPDATAQCPQALFQAGAGGGFCPLASQVGIEATYAGGAEGDVEPVYNLVPPPGAPAELGFSLLKYGTLLVSSPRTGGDYGISTHVDDIVQKSVMGNVLTVWGDPADPAHDTERGECYEANYERDNVRRDRGEGPGIGELVSCPVAESETPFLTLPTQCGAPPVFSINLLSWEGATAQASVPWHDSEGNPVGITGCEPLHFEPSITLAPDTAFADTPAGLTAELTPPVGGLLEPEGRSTSDVKDTKVVLPAGIAINPGQAAGLVACQASEDSVGTEEAARCPAASKVGTVEITTPLLPDKVLGNVYVLPSNPPDLELLIAASADGVYLKIPGHVQLNEQTGQLTTTFQETPPLPFTDFKLSFSGGAQAALATPAHCGAYTSSVDFTPWSSPFVADALEESSFAITAGTGGAPCPVSGPLPYSPELTAGSTTDQAGGYTDFSLLLQVPDDDQRTSRLQFKTPEGLLGMISRVQLCSNAQAEANACPAASQIGHTVVQSGPGPYPLVVPQPGQPPAPIYLTEGYGGGNYGLSIVVPLHVGPFTLPTQRVRASIAVDPLTSQLTITTDPLPQYVAGVPTDLRTIDAVIDRPEFMFNPTGCEPQSFSGTAFGSEGAASPIASHFQMGSCQALKFQPNFKVFTSGHTSRADGASLGVKIVYPVGNLGANQASSQSNIRMVKVELPKRLPSRLVTLQKACTAAQFNSNPAGCPAASVVGHVRVLTPVLPVPLEGPAYFVSNGGEAFPNLIMVIQGYGVTIHLVGDTFINKAGITSSTFKAVPDVPIQSFELDLPQGPDSALAANGDLCKAKNLVMPTEFIGQNGAEIHQNTKIEVQGCPKAKKTKHKQTKRTKHKKKRRAQ